MTQETLSAYPYGKWIKTHRAGYFWEKDKFRDAKRKNKEKIQKLRDEIRALQNENKKKWGRKLDVSKKAYMAYVDEAKKHAEESGFKWVEPNEVIA